MTFARDLWQRIETLHAVTYFGPETQDATRALGIDGFWMGYFGLRAAPLGPVAPGVVDATFANFAPTFVRRWVPAVWDLASPAALLDARAAAAAATLARVAPSIGRATGAVESLAAAVEPTPATIARPLYAANRDLPSPADPVAALWQVCTTLREHRGDGHVAALAAEGLDGLESHVLRSAADGTDPEDLQRTRGWTADDWAAAVARLTQRGLVDGPQDGPALTPAGADVHASVEATTDRLADQPFAALGDADRRALLDLLTPAAAEVASSGTLRYPNPIGLPAFTDGR